MNSISLFSGAMGLDIGLEMAGFKTMKAVEFDKSCQKTIAKNRPTLELFGDICGLSPDELVVPDLQLICGGPPCQPFSTAGKRLSFDDARGTLVFEFVRLIQALKPRFFVMENVKGLTSATSDGGARGDVLTVILNHMQSALGYTLTHEVVNAVDYGVPQFRERLLIIGSRDHEPIFIPEKTHFQRHQDPAYRWRTLRSAIHSISVGAFDKFSPDRERWLAQVPPGGNWRNLNPSEQEAAMGGAFKSGGGKTGFFRRLSMDEPCPTLVTSPSQKSTLLCHPTETRPLSVTEYAAIQQFPKEWAFCGSLSDQYRQIGNAVPIGLGYAIGQMLASVISGTSVVKTKRSK